MGNIDGSIRKISVKWYSPSLQMCNYGISPTILYRKSLHFTLAGENKKHENPPNKNLNIMRQEPFLPSSLLPNIR